MSFKEIESAVGLANKALGMISEQSITSLDDAGARAEKVKRWYKPVVARLLETHHWGLATKRASLVALPTNDRSAEWLYAYSAPDDMAFPVGVAFASGTSSVSYYRGLSGLIAMAYGKPIFQFHNGTLYSNMAGDLEFVSFDITEADFNATFANIVILMLASRLALELPKDREMSDDLAAEARSEMNMAITQNLNIGNRQYGMQVSEGEMARGSLYGTSWDYFPLAAGA